MFRSGYAYTSKVHSGRLQYVCVSHRTNEIRAKVMNYFYFSQTKMKKREAFSLG